MPAPLKPKYVRSPEALACRAARAREIRDLYNKLRKIYRPAIVDKFFRDNYFLQPRTVEIFVKESDNLDVDLDSASIIYITAIQDSFKL